MAKKAWGGRFEKATSHEVEAFTSSVDDDKHLAVFDIAGSIAHANMLAAQGIIAKDECERLVGGLEQIEAELEGGSFVWLQSREDVHMNIEGRLAEIVGADVAGKLHTARSRNDQVALDLRLFLRRRLMEVRGQLRELILAFLGQADGHLDTLLPGYTHFQRGQPVRLAHHLLAYVQMFSRDAQRIDDLLARMTLSPLGAGALAGTPHPIDRNMVAADLGFSGVTANSMDTVSDRDDVMEALSIASISMIHLSRLCEELVVWSSQEFGFVRIGDAYATGSSMMPQKKNPDVAELVRGKTGRVIGSNVSVLVMMKGLPLCYNRDMQEDKPPLYDSLNTWCSSLSITAKMVATVDFNTGKMSKALELGFVNATELADYLVTKEVPFRMAHEVVGKIVKDAEKHSRVLSDYSGEELKKFHESFGPDVEAWLDMEKAVERRAVKGGPAKVQVLSELASARQLWDAE